MKKILLLLTLIATFVSFSQKNQNEMLSSFSSGKYSVYKVEKVSYNTYEFVPIKKQWPLEINKSGGQVVSVLVKRSGILDELFKPDIPGHPAYFAYKEYRLSFVDGMGIYYTWNAKEQATTKYVFVESGKSLRKDFEEVNKIVANYAKSVFKNQTGARAKVKEQKAVLVEEERKRNSLQNKQVKSIAIQLVATPKHVAHFSEAIRYGVVATLKNGTKLKTPNLGGKLPWSDFKLQNKGCSNSIDELRVDIDAKTLTSDQITIQVVSKYHPSLRAIKKMNATYDIPIRVDQNGFYGWDRHKYVTVYQGIDGQHGGRGHNLVVKVKATTHKQTGKKINKIHVYDTSENKLVAQYKLTPNTKFYVNCIGGKGMGGFDGRSSSSPNGGNGGNGGDGGNITLIKDPSVVQANIILNNEGGAGGRGGAPKYSSASKGRSGRKGQRGAIYRQTKPVNLNF